MDLSKYTRSTVQHEAFLDFAALRAVLGLPDDAEVAFDVGLVRCRWTEPAETAPKPEPKKAKAKKEEPVPVPPAVETNWEASLADPTEAHIAALKAQIEEQEKAVGPGTVRDVREHVGVGPAMPLHALIANAWEKAVRYSGELQKRRAPAAAAK